MRGHLDPQGHLFSYLSPDKRVPADHPLRTIKSFADEALKALANTFNSMYSEIGRPSIPPERLLKANLLIALYSVRSDRLFCEMLDYNILFRWFLDMSLDEASFDASTFSKNRERLVRHEVALKFFDAVVWEARHRNLLSDEHFSVDGTLIEAWASLKSFQKKDGSGNGPDDDGDIDFKGEKRSNATHESTTDPESKLLRKGRGKEAKLCFAGHALMDNRHGLVTDLTVTPSVGVTEPEAALGLIDRQRENWVPVASVGGDKGYHTREFVKALRARKIKPHLARKEGHRTAGLDGRTARTAGYQMSQRIRKRIEQVFGWGKTVGGMRKSRMKGIARTRLWVLLSGAAYNLVRLSRLCPLTG